MYIIFTPYIHTYILYKNIALRLIYAIYTLTSALPHPTYLQQSLLQHTQHIDKHRQVLYKEKRKFH